ncbi:AzlD family protein [Elioraea rosea]|uniref:AzlD family protein n=1 Tax=Elioraea rosea TaxID=2492390 RepID=UPI0011838C87|nr:AzlD domain-containing protein [Elioraea rosea]
MTAGAEALLAIAAMGVASFACRAGGFLAMRLVTVTSRVEACLKAVPVALVGAILGPIAVHGGPADWLGLAAAAVAMRVLGHDLAACVIGISVAAAARATGA